jgi:hypothetical protein
MRLQPAISTSAISPPRRVGDTASSSPQFGPGGDLDGPVNRDGHPRQVLEVGYRRQEGLAAFRRWQGRPENVALAIDDSEGRGGIANHQARGPGRRLYRRAPQRGDERAQATVSLLLDVESPQSVAIDSARLAVAPNHSDRRERGGERFSRQSGRCLARQASYGAGHGGTWHATSRRRAVTWLTRSTAGHCGEASADYHHASPGHHRNSASRLRSLRICSDAYQAVCVAAAGRQLRDMRALASGLLSIIGMGDQTWRSRWTCWSSGPGWPD